MSTPQWDTPEGYKTRTGYLPDPHDIEVSEREIRLATRSAIYRTDPLEPRVREAFAAATAEQLRARKWSADLREQMTATSPLGVPLASAEIGDAKWSAGDVAGAIPDTYRFPRGGGLCSAALDVLEDAGLLRGVVGVYG